MIYANICKKIRTKYTVFVKKSEYTLNLYGHILAAYSIYNN